MRVSLQTESRIALEAAPQLGDEQRHLQQAVRHVATQVVSNPAAVSRELLAGLGLCALGCVSFTVAAMALRRPFLMAPTFPIGMLAAHHWDHAQSGLAHHNASAVRVQWRPLR
jgi:hypothetical protein